VKLIYRHFPFLGQESLMAAHASECASDQGMFLKYREGLYLSWDKQEGSLYAPTHLSAVAENLDMDTNEFNECNYHQIHLNKIKSMYDEAHQLGVNSTPTTIIQGELISGLGSYEYYSEIIDSKLRDQLQ